MPRKVPKQQPEAEVRLAIRWQDPSPLPTLYANQVYVSHAGGEFYLVFGEVQQPVLVNVDAEELRNIKEIQVKPVAKLVFTHNTLVSIVKAISDNLATFERRSQQEGEATRP